MARFLPEYGLLFQHVPRAGGTFVEEALQACDLKFSRWVSKQPRYLPKKHSLLEHYHREPMRNVQHVAAFVRRPVDYYVSVWCWIANASPRNQKRMLAKWSWHPHATATTLWVSDFDLWAERLLEAEPAWATRLYENYVGPQGGEFCNYIGRNETIAADFVEVCEFVGIDTTGWDAKLQSLGKPNAAKVDRPVPSEATRKLIEREERVILRRFYRDNEGRRLYGSWAMDQE